MARRAARPVVSALREALRATARNRPRVRRLMTLAARELARALDDDVYGAHYFGAGRDPLDRMGLSGYERYDRDTSNANVAAYLVWRWFDVRRALDVGCATGFVVEALRELGIGATGVDVSQYAVEQAAAGAAGHIGYGDLTRRLPARDGQYDLVTVLETLEHLPPEVVPHALAELRRVTRGYVLATIPSFGPNPNGPGGWFTVKVRDERVPHYESLGPDYEGPIPFEDLYRDARGEPIEGHLTIASFAWWTARFADAGFVRCGEVERRMHPHLARFGLTKYWNLYVFRVPDAPEPGPDVRTPEEIARWEANFGLDRRQAAPEDLAAVAAALMPPLPST
ncbi:MAG: class I SAM-dependent methyltransferase [Actinomycetota bacterium]|nr:class I SAM-dependent methyltransferase [Actinomycetota bacterium]